MKTDIYYDYFLAICEMLIVGRVLYSHHAAYKLLDKRGILKAILSAIVASDGRAACLYSARCRSVSRLSQVLSNPAANTISQCRLSFGAGG